MALIAKILSKFDDSGLKQAKKGFGGLSKTIGALGIGIGLKAITDTLLDSAKAASADQKSIKLLTSQLQKATGATDKQVAANEKFLSQLSMQVGIADDDLRPAMAGFARVTGSVTKAQDLLKLALDGAATKGVPLKKVSDALSKAYAGNESALKRMFPELKKSKDLMGDFAKIVSGEAIAQATPFDKITTAMGELQEKLGGLVLPYVVQFVDEMMKPGGAIEQVGKFLEDVSNPKTQAGAMFLQVKDAVEKTIQGVKDFFAVFGNGDAIKGFGNVASALVTMLPALLALKAIMMLASTGKAISGLITAMTAIAGKGAVPGTNLAPVATGAGATLGGFAVVAAASAYAGEVATQVARDQIKAESGKTFTLNTSGNMAFQTGGPTNDLFGFKAEAAKNKPVVNNVVINVQNADPKAVVDALGKYVKNNGKLPSALFPGVKP